MLRKIAIAGLCLATAHSAAVDKLQKRDGAHAHDHAADRDAGYGAPPASYEPPAAEYSAPATSYGSSGVGYEEEALPDLTPILVAMLTLAGLSLLFPQIVCVAAGTGGNAPCRRKKRHADGKRSCSCSLFQHAHATIMQG